MTKRKRDETRLDMKRLLSNLDSGWMKEAGQELCVHLSELLKTERFSERKRILAWTSFFAGEVDLSPFVSDLVTQRQVYLPRSLPDMSMSYISIGRNWNEEVVPGQYGIPEPMDGAGEPFDLETMAHEAIVLVPGVAFDQIGNRIGRGKGYYDRFLGKQGGSSMVKIGVCWNLQLVKTISAEPHDIPMDYVCHEEGVLRTSMDSEGEFLS